MNIREIMKMIDFSESIIIEIGNTKSDSYIIIEEPYEIELIANGYRPSFDMSPRHKIIFKKTKIDYVFRGYEPIANVNYDNALSIKTRNFELLINDTEVEIIPNYDFDSRR